MKFVREAEVSGAHIPGSALHLSRLGRAERLELHTLEGAVVLLNGRMSAMELLTTAKALQRLAVDLYVHLAKACGPCDGCEGGCPFELLRDIGISLSGCPLEELFEDAPKKAEAQPHAAGRSHSLQDVPVELLETLSNAGACLGELQEHLLRGDVIYCG